MARYRVTYKTDASFGYYLRETQIVETDQPMSIKEMASHLNIAVDSILHIEVL